MERTQCTAILLRQTWLANDDAILNLFTDKYGLITVFAKSLARSRQRQTQLDWFRLLAVTVSRKSQYFRLEQVETLALYPVFTTSWERYKLGQAWISLLGQICPNDKPQENIFRFCDNLWRTATLTNPLLAWDVFFRGKMLIFSGLWTNAQNGLDNQSSFKNMTDKQLTVINQLCMRNCHNWAELDFAPEVDWGLILRALKDYEDSHYGWSKRLT